MVSRKVLIWSPAGPDARGQILQGLLERSGRYRVRSALGLGELGAGLPDSDAVVIHGGGPKELPPEQEQALLAFVRSGKGAVVVHESAGLFRPAAARELLGCTVARPPADAEHLVKVNPDHQATRRLGDFVLTDRPCFPDAPPAGAEVGGSTLWLGKPVAVLIARSVGRGRVFYSGLGSGPEQLADASLARALVHGLDWTCRVSEARGPIRCAMLGYGGAFAMGKIHSDQINATPGLTAVAACDVDPARREQAKKDFPNFRTYPDLPALLKARDVDLVVNILPHNLHAETTLACLRAGKHVVSEKPFCLTVREADAMIRAASAAGVMLTVYHNRRWDGDYLTIRRLIAGGVVGEVFEIDCGFSGYSRPREWWRSDKTISGGNLYDWGAHFVDWVLGLIPRRIVSVSGFFHKKVWMHVTSEDHTQAIVRFEDGAKADVTLSSISAAPRPRWRILGTRGAIVDDGSVPKAFKVFTYEDGQVETRIVPFAASRHQEFYYNVADHLLLGDELAVKPRQARRTIGVIEYAERSSRSGRAEVFPGEVAPAPAPGKPVRRRQIR